MTYPKIYTKLYSTECHRFEHLTIHLPITGCHIIHAPLRGHLHNFSWLVMINHLITLIFVQLLLSFKHTWKKFSPKWPFFILLQIFTVILKVTKPQQFLRTMHLNEKQRIYYFHSNTRSPCFTPSVLHLLALTSRFLFNALLLVAQLEATGTVQISRRRTKVLRLPTHCILRQSPFAWLLAPTFWYIYMY